MAEGHGYWTPRAEPWHASGRPEEWAAIAVAPDGLQVAYLVVSDTGAVQPTPSSSSTGSSPNSRLDQVWVTPVGLPGEPRLAFQLESGEERLVDLSWSPDSQQLLLVTRLASALSGEQTRLLWLASLGR